MKTISSIILALFALIGAAMAQAPQAFKYQAILRDASNAPLVSQAVSLRMSILEGSPSGTNVYQETHTDTTTALGLIALNVGEGTVVSGTFASINWGADSHFLQIEVDNMGGTNFQLLGVSQLLSVPYALYADRAESAATADSIADDDADPVNEIQDLFISGNSLSISLGNTVTLPSYVAGVGIDITGNVISNTGDLDPTDDLTIGSAALGDLGDFYPAPTVVGIRGIPVATSTPLNGQILKYNGSQWAIADDDNTPSLWSSATGGIFYNSGVVSIGSSSLPTDADLYVDGNIRVKDDADLLGLDILQGFNDLRLAGDPNGGEDMRIDATGRIGIRGVFNNAAFSLINFPGNTGTNGGILFASTTAGSDRLQVWDTTTLGVFVIGNFTVTSGTKNFGLDHPLDPANKNLFHNAVESPGYVTYYHGTVKLDANGEGVVSMPDYFEALNKDFNYQLTCIGGYAQVYIAEKINGNRFKIAGGKAGMEVSWQVTATRNDPWAKDHPYEAEQIKYPHQKGKYWYPEGYGKGQDFQIGKRDNKTENK
ncbi:MAG: hypothetical protein MRZ79_15385 [Bacteroidia bacterium]|nr:hypothetical protein [Bacteroidia bacterium]